MSLRQRLLLPWRWRWWVWAILAYVAVETLYRDAYAVSWVAGMVTQHLEANNEEWPRCWEDLRDDYEVAALASGRPWSFEELTWRVNVDWRADTEQLTNVLSRGERLRVIWLRDGLIAYWGREEPNQIIGEYLRERLQHRPADALQPM